MAIAVAKQEHDFGGNLSPVADRAGNDPGKGGKGVRECLKIKEIAFIFTYARNFIYLGRGLNFPVALEGALKLKEISYIHAEGFPAAK